MKTDSEKPVIEESPKADLHPNSKPTAPDQPSAAEGGDHHYKKIEKIGRSALIDRDLASRLSRQSPSALALRLGLDYALIVAAVVLCELYGHPALYVLAIMIIGARMAGIGSVALHDGVHRLLARDGKLNDRIGRMIGVSVGVPFVEDFYGYRKRHFAHHRLTNTDDDPEGFLAEKFYDLPRWKGALLLLHALSGLMFVQLLLRFLFQRLKSNKIVGLIAVGCTAALIFGVVRGFYPAVLFVKYWVIPLGTWGLFVNLIRAVAEHYPVSEFQRGDDFPEVFRTRDVLNSWFDQIFVATRGVNYHLSHHLIPNVPFYRLPELQRALAKSEPYRNYAHVTRGYHRFLLEYFFQRSQRAGLGAVADAANLELG